MSNSQTDSFHKEVLAEIQKLTSEILGCPRSHEAWIAEFLVSTAVLHRGFNCDTDGFMSLFKFAIQDIAPALTMETVPSVKGIPS